MNTTQLQLDYPAWRLPWSAYGELLGLDLSQTESCCQWFDSLDEQEAEVQTSQEDRL